MDRTRSPSPRFSENGSQFIEHFTEHNASPPYQLFQNFFDAYDAPVSQSTTQGRESQHGLTEKRPQPLSPTEIAPPLPESYHADHEEKEVAIPPVRPEAYQRPSQSFPQKRRFLGMPLPWLFVAVGVGVALGIGLGVGLGIGLSSDSSHDEPASPTQPIDTQFLIGGSIDPEFYSKEGAFNGSGIALASQSFSQNLQEGTQGSLVLYFQHHTGQIRWKQLSTSGEWLGGDISEVVASDAKNSTPLSAVSYVLDGSSTWHVFYVAGDNTIKQRTNSNTTNVWEDGPINDMQIKVFDADQVGMQACWYGNDYGDSDYAHTPLPNRGPAANSSGEVGMHLWYAQDATTFQQLGWRQGDDAWQAQQTFTQKNGHAGVGCYSWGPGTVTYAMMVSPENQVEFWWKDTNTNLTNTTSHPINVWTKSSLSIDNVDPSTSLGYTNFFYAQDGISHMIKGYNISWAAENTTIVEQDSFTVQGEAGLPGTHLSVSAIPNTSGGNNLVVFYQVNGSHISEYTRDLVAGQWSSVAISIPE